MPINTNFLLAIGLAILLPNLVLAKMNDFACEPEWKWLAEQIGGDKIKSFSATTAKQNPHFISAKPSLIAKMRKADIVFGSGSSLEAGWLPVLLKLAGKFQVLPNNIGYFMASDKVKKLEVITDDSLIDRSLGDIHPEGNPHVHLDPRNLITIASEFSQILEKIDPENSSYYQSRFQQFSHFMKNKISFWEKKASILKEKTFIVFHKQWVYLANWLGFKIQDSLEPKPGIAPSAKHLAKLVKKYKNNKVYAILYTSWEDNKAVQWLSKKIDSPALELPYTGSDMIKVFEEVINLLL